MACFLVSAAEALVVTVVTKAVEKSEKKREVPIKESAELAPKVPFSRKLKWLRHMLWGGSALLMFEHIWHGEVVPFFPFLTAAANRADAAEMLHEMATVGVSMAALVTAVWLGIVGVTALLEKRAAKEARAALPQEG